MEITVKRSAQVVGFLLVSAAATQALYTVLYLVAPDIVRLPIWSAEAVIFVLLAAFATGPLVHSRRLTIGWGAILAAGVLNVVQVGVGLTMFYPFIDAAKEHEALAPVAGAIVAFSFFVYNAAKTLIALAAVIFGLAKLRAARSGQGAAKALGGAAALVGVVAIFANAASMAMGRDVFGELPLAGGTGVLATLLLALCVSGAVETRD